MKKLTLSILIAFSLTSCEMSKQPQPKRRRRTFTVELKMMQHVYTNNGIKPQYLVYVTYHDTNETDWIYPSESEYNYYKLNDIVSK